MKTCLRYLAVVFAVAMMVVTFSTVSASFSDVPATNPHIGAINTMTNLGIVAGYEDGTFKPDNLVTRAEMAKIIYVTYNTFVDAGNGETNFTDVPADHWAKGYISWCSTMGIVKGCGDGTFKPDGYISYDQALAMVCSMLGYTDFEDGVWPIDVRIKGLLELGLGTGLEKFKTEDGIQDVAGETLLTRAEVVRLVFNAFNKPMYDEEAAKETILPGIYYAKEEKTIAKDIWNYTEKYALVVATENYGYKNEWSVNDKYDVGTAGITAPKLGDSTKVTLLYEDDTVEDVALADIGLEQYEGKNDELFLLGINIYSRGIEQEKVATVVGYRKEGFASGSAETTSIKIDGVTYTDDNFKALRRLNHENVVDGLVEATGYYDKSGNKIETFINCDGMYEYNKQNIAWLLQKSVYTMYKMAIDSNGDGYYDFLILAPHDTYKVTNATSSNVTIEDLFGLGISKTFKMANVESVQVLEEGSIVSAYFLADKLYIPTEVAKITSFITRRETNDNKFMLYGQTDTYTHNNASPMREAKMSLSFFGSLDIINDETGDFNYVNVYLVDKKVVWGELADMSAMNSNGLKKAILLYVAKPTEPQFNERTKSYEIYYPAYLLIGGVEHLVNLNPENAINGLTADIVAQDNTEYRQYVVTDTSEAGLVVDRVMYPNILVTYTVDNNGYYSLSTNTVDKDVEVDEKVVEKIVANANGDYTLSFNKATEIGTIKDALGNTVVDRVIFNDATVLYYPYTKASTGIHEYIEYHLGHELTSDMGEVTLTSEIYLTPDEETGFWVINTAVVANKIDKIEEDTTTTADPTKDARVHLFATVPTEAVLLEGEVRASYSFKNLYDYEDVTSVNKSLSYNQAKKTVFANIYAWDKDTKNYVDASDAWASYESGEEITSAIPSMNLIFTESLFADGVKLDGNTKILAVMNSLHEEYEMAEITIEDLATLLETIETYNAEKSASEKLTATIGTYVEEDATRVAYILVDWVEYDADEDIYTVAGVIK